MINIAVLGYGTVGSGVVEVINTNHESINKRAGDEINIKYVLDLRDFPGDPVEKVLVHDYEVIVNDPEVDIVVEVMGGIEPAYTFVKRALQAGKSVSTSNKALVAKHGSELMEIAKEKNINFLFEASCGGGIPIIRALNSSLTADEIDEITGMRENERPSLSLSLSLSTHSSLRTTLLLPHTVATLALLINVFINCATTERAQM